MRHRCKVKGEQAITLQMAQQLKTKNLMLYQDNCLDFIYLLSQKLNIY